MTKLGSDKRPAAARVQTMAKAEEIITLCNKRDWKVIIGIEPDKSKHIFDMEWLLTSPTIIRDKPKVDRNDHCPCGSGLKFKKCCLKQI